MKTFVCMLALIAALGVQGCGGAKVAAESAITASETAFNATKEQAMKIAPDQVQAIETAIADAKAKVAAGDYKAALDLAKAIPGQVKGMTDGLAAKQAELQAKLDAVKDLPAQLAAVQQKVSQLDAMKKLPSGMSKSAVQTAKDGFASAQAMYAEMDDAVKSGQLAEAVSKLEPLKQLLAQVMTALGMPVPDMLKA